MTYQRHHSEDVTLKPVGSDDYSYPLHMTGSVSLCQSEPERDIGAELRAVFKEVTGQDMPAPDRPRIGFLP